MLGIIESPSAGAHADALPCIRPDTGKDAVVDIGATAAQSPVVVGGGVVRLIATIPCHLAVGTAPTATTGNLFLPANTPEYFMLNDDDRLSVVRSSGVSESGKLYITEAKKLP